MWRSGYIGRDLWTTRPIQSRFEAGSRRESRSKSVRGSYGRWYSVSRLCFLGSSYCISFGRLRRTLVEGCNQFCLTEIELGWLGIIKGGKAQPLRVQNHDPISIL